MKTIITRLRVLFLHQKPLPPRWIQGELALLPNRRCWFGDLFWPLAIEPRPL